MTSATDAVLLALTESQATGERPDLALSRAAAVMLERLGAERVAIKDVAPVTRRARVRAAIGAGGAAELVVPATAGQRTLGSVELGFKTAPDQRVHDAAVAIGRLLGLALLGWHADETSRQLSAVLDVCTEFVTGVELDGHVTFMNPALRRRLGIAPDAPVPTLLDYRPPGWSALVEEQILPAVLAHGVWQGLTDHVTAGGEMFRVAQTTIANRDPDGVVHSITNVAREIGAETLVTAELRAAEERMRFALEAAHAGVWEHDLVAGRVIWSDTMRNVQGFPADEAGGTFDSLIALIHPGDRAAVTALVAHAIESAESFETTFRLLWPDGSLHRIEAHARVMTDPVTRSPSRILGFAQDVTERVALEDRVRQSQRVEAVGLLAGGLAHDFNNLLTVILGFAGLITESLDPDDARRDEVEEIRRAGMRGAELTRQLLAFSRQQVLQPVVLNLNRHVDEVSRMLRRLAGENIEFITELATDLPPIRVDPGQIEQVLVNLVVNARDAMASGGRLTIRTSCTQLPATDKTPEIPAVKLEVSDTGVGMDDAVKARIFEPFFTTKALGQGTGLGLATVHGIVAQSNGTIAVQSAPGHGSTFTVVLPAASGAEAVAETPVEAFPRGTETILVVEDDPAVRALVAATLRRCGYETLVAPGPKQALALAAGRAGTIDMLLSDVIMPGMSGSELFKELAPLRPAMSVAYMSGFAHRAIEHHGVLKPGVTFLQKPFTASALAGKVRAHLDAATASASASSRSPRGTPPSA